jgi:adiponectin receptor
VLRANAGGAFDKQQGYMALVSAKQMCEIAAWRVENRYIRSGYYRVCNGDWKLVIRSLCVLNNETMNVYSHVIGCIFALALGIDVFMYFMPYHSANAWETLSFVPLFLGSVSVCFLSATYHLLWIHSPSMAKFWQKMDYIGIVFQMVGGFVTLIISLFWCKPGLMSLYITFHSAVAAWVVRELLQDRFGEPDHRLRRTLIFGALLATILAPMLHSVSMDSNNSRAKAKVLQGLGWFLLSQVIGGLFFASLFPECLNPGAFDRFGKSHEWMHWSVVVGISIFYDTAKTAFTNRHGLSATGGMCY